jgi:hypothetical protein
VLHLAGPDPKGQRPERPVRGGVGVPAHRDAPREGEPLLRPDDVNDALPLVGKGEVLEAKVLDVLLKLQHLRPARRLLDEGLHVDELGPVRRGDVVVDRHQRAVRPPDAPAGEAKPLEGLRGRHLVHQVPVDVDEGRLAVVVDEVVVPDFVVQGPAGVDLQ